MMVLQAKLAVVLTVLLALTACADTPEYLEEDIPPCTPAEGSAREPCEPTIPAVDTGSASLTQRDDPMTIRMMLGEWHEYRKNGVLEPALSRPYVTRQAGYMVVRATYLPGTVRCEVNRDFRTFGDTTEITYNPAYINGIQCFADIRVNSYILGDGPPKMAVMAADLRVGEGPLTVSQQDAIVMQQEQELEGQGENGIAGREAVLFIGPAFDYTVKVWEVHRTWGVNQLDDGTVMILHPHWSQWLGAKHRSQVEMTLADFTAAAL